MLRSQHRDRARIITKKKSNARVAGGYSKVPQPGPWFRCDYDPGSEDEQRGEGGFRRRRAGASLECPSRALDGSSIEVKAADTVEIDSQRFGTLTLDITGTPEKLVQGRVHIGWILDLAVVNRKAAG